LRGSLSRRGSRRRGRALPFQSTFRRRLANRLGLTRGVGRGLRSCVRRAACCRRSRRRCRCGRTTATVVACRPWRCRAACCSTNARQGFRPSAHTESNGKSRPRSPCHGPEARRVGRWRRGGWRRRREAGGGGWRRRRSSPLVAVADRRKLAFVVSDLTLVRRAFRKAEEVACPSSRGSRIRPTSPGTRLTSMLSATPGDRAGRDQHARRW